MADQSESTPFLADNDHGDSYEETNTQAVRTLPAKAHFKRAIRILTALILLLSISVFGLLIASYVLLHVGPFEYIWSSQDTVRDLAICLFVNFILSAPTVFIQIPILINMAVNIAMSIVILVFSTNIFGSGLPESSACHRWDYPDYNPLPETEECRHARDVVRIMMIVSADCGVIIGLLILTTLLLQFIVVARTKFWEGQKLGSLQGLTGRNPHGFTVQFTLNVMKQEPPKPVHFSSGGEEGRLIET